jgi:HlyD family secretion protein
VSLHAVSAPAKTDALRPETVAVLERIGASKRSRRRRLLIMLVLVAAGLGGAWWWMQRTATDTSPVFETVPADRADIEVHVVATGSLQARSTVLIGAEISGRVASVAVEANERVKKGQVLVHLDPETAANALEEAQASLRSSTADLARAKASLAEAKSVEKRAASLAKQGLVSSEEANANATAVMLADADVARASSQIKLAKIRVDQAKTNLSKLVIVSPLDGVVLSRTVEPGNTIAASLSAPQLFSIAEDLAKMELQLPINEADVGRVTAGQQATFKVDAWPERTFEARVTEVSFAPVITTNVVTYTAVLEVDNTDLALRPGMTATATIVSETKPNVLRVPNGAIRFTPQLQESKAFSLMPQPRGRMGGGNRNRAVPPGVWVLRDGQPVRVRLTLGTSDGAYTEVVDGELAEGDEIIVGQERPRKAGGGGGGGGARPQ